MEFKINKCNTETEGKLNSIVVTMEKMNNRDVTADKKNQVFIMCVLYALVIVIYILKDIGEKFRIQISI